MSTRWWQVLVVASSWRRPPPPAPRPRDHRGRAGDRRSRDRRPAVAGGEVVDRRARRGGGRGRAARGRGLRATGYAGGRGAQLRPPARDARRQDRRGAGDARGSLRDLHRDRGARDVEHGRLDVEGAGHQAARGRWRCRRRPDAGPAPAPAPAPPSFRCSPRRRRPPTTRRRRSGSTRQRAAAQRALGWTASSPPARSRIG